MPNVRVPSRNAAKVPSSAHAHAAAVRFTLWLIRRTIFHALCRTPSVTIDITVHPSSISAALFCRSLVKLSGPECLTVWVGRSLATCDRGLPSGVQPKP